MVCSGLKNKLRWIYCRSFSKDCGSRPLKNDSTDPKGKLRVGLTYREPPQKER